MPGYEVLGAEELAQVAEVFSNGGVMFRHGFDDRRNNCYKVRDFELAFAKAMGGGHALAVTSGTSAIRVALAALGIGAGDEVITQSFTFVATAEAIIESRATPVIAEINSTLNLCPEDLRRKISPRTRAVIVVHMLGCPADLKEISAICEEHDLILIEDTAWGCGGNLEDTALGTWGDVGTFSFDFAKTMTTGEGGMVLCKDKSVYEKAAAWHDHGHENNPKVPRWEDTRSGSGFNYRMMELQGALGLAQLAKLEMIVDAQRSNRDKIWSQIADLPGVIPRNMPKNSFDTADALVFLTHDKATALDCRQQLIAEGLSTKILPEAISWHFAGTWEHMKEIAEVGDGTIRQAYPESRAILERAVSLPIGVYMPDDCGERARRALLKALN